MSRFSNSSLILDTCELCTFVCLYLYFQLGLQKQKHIKASQQSFDEEHMYKDKQKW